MSLHRVISIVREVPDLDATRAFFRDFGLTETAPGVFATVLGGDQLYLREAPRPRIAEITVAAETVADVEAIAERLTGLGMAHERTGEDGSSLEAVAPLTDVLVRVQVADRLPADPRPVVRTSIDRGDLVQREPVKPLRLGHVAMGVTDVEEAKVFFIDGLGMRLSDYVMGGPFMRFETDHHNIVLVPAPMPLLHHTAWKVRNVDEIGYGGSRMIERHEERHAWGLGRHAASANYFWYLKDPGGAFSEYYYSEMDDLADGPYFWDPHPDTEELPVAAWASPPFVEAPLSPGALATGLSSITAPMPELMPAPILTEGV